MIPAERSHLFVAAQSHPGMSGKNNEDRFAVSAFRVSRSNPTPSLLAVVSDGIGGHRAGEVAADIAVETISQVVAASDTRHPTRTLAEAISQASQTIYAQSEFDENQRGMGATCACCWIIGDRLYIAHVGDSRIYLVRGESMQQLTVDHTWIQEAIEHGILTPDQARGHPNAHIIRRYLGSRQPVVPDLRLVLHPEDNDEQAVANQGVTLLPGDRLILCSDGLTDLVSDGEIATILKANGQAKALDTLIDLANRRGGHDNITVIGLQMPLASSQTIPLQPVTQPQPARRLSLSCLGLSTLLVLTVVILVGAYGYFNGWNFLPTGGLSASPTVQTTLSLSSSPESGTPLLTSSPQVSAPTGFPRATGTPLLNPHPAGPTLTPWPTNTRQP